MVRSIDFTPNESEVMIVLINQYLESYSKHCNSWGYELNQKLVSFFDECLLLFTDGYFKQINVVIEVDDIYEQDFNSISFIALNRKDMCSVEKKEIYKSCFFKTFKIFENNKGKAKSSLRNRVGE